LSRQPDPIAKKPAMAPFFEEIADYRTLGKVELNPKALRMLKVDDYIFIDYEGPDGKINLFIGYYYTIGKAYASHSPLICYPSQGWKIEKPPVTKTIYIGSNRIKHEQILTSFGNKQEIVLYWFQSYLLTNTNSYMNKINIAINRLLNENQQHALVRVAVPTNDGYFENSQNAAQEFIKAFYPILMDYITTN
jgi:EpsI family protein